MELVARRDELDMRLARKLRYGLAGILRWNIEMPDLGGGRRTSAEHRYRKCGATRCSLTPAPQAPLLLLCTLGDEVGPLLIRDQMSDERLHFPTASVVILVNSHFASAHLYLEL